MPVPRSSEARNASSAVPADASWDHLDRLEARARMLEPGPDVRRDWTEQVIAQAERFLTRLADAPTYVPRGPDDPSRAVADVPLAEEGLPLDTLLRTLETADVPGINPASGGHLGYIPGGGLFPSALADLLADVENRYSGIFYAGPSAVRIENRMIRWMCELVGYPQGAWGDLTSGGSIANLTAIVAARQAAGLRGADLERAVVYRTPQTHHCVTKALRIAGLGDAPVREIALDAQWRMDIGALETAIRTDRAQGLRPFLIVASAGTTDTGAVDPLGPVAEVAEREGLWLHVDAAYGGFFALVDRLRPLFADLRRADSVVLDPHKGLFLPYGSGAVLVRRGAALRDAFGYEAAYMRDAADEPEEPSPAHHSPELTRPFRGLRMWLPLHLFGVGPFRAALEEKLELARYFHARVRELPDMEVGPPPTLSVVCFRWAPPGRDPDEATRALTDALHADGRVFLSSTRIDGALWLRCAVLSFRTHRRQIDQALELIATARARLA
ncbi:MAG: aminotransferase class V-fold PLP-dependent enzyme [Gemmatimonadetes bacterium]|nr:aminotransferase class V-fold PLP-dependent enzyme [Gemmatimonadota bacterium]